MSRTTLPAVFLCALAFLVAVAPASADPQPRIVGGGTVSISSYPWQAALTRSHNKVTGSPFQRLRCGGSLIAPQIVITAAHCVEDDDPDCETHQPVLPCTPATDPPPGDGTNRMDFDDLEVVLGSTTLSDAAANEKPLIDIDMVHTPAYDPDELDNDYSLLVLGSPSAQQTIDIAGDDEDAVWAPGAWTEVSGWGATSQGGSKSNTLKAAVTPIISDAVCGSPENYDSEFHAATMVCAGYIEGGIDTCHGDSGGPLEGPLEGGGYRLVGLTSWGVGCAQPNAPGVYTRIASDALRDSIVEEVQALEALHDLPPEDIVGSGAEPREAPPTPPPLPEVNPPQPLDPAPSAARKKCLKKNKRRVRHGKRKRKCPKT